MFWKRSEPEQTLAAERGRSPSDAASVCSGAGEPTPAAAVDHPQVVPPAEITPPLTAATVVDQVSAGAPPGPQADEAFVGEEPPREEPFEEVRKPPSGRPAEEQGTAVGQAPAVGPGGDDARAAVVDPRHLAAKRPAGGRFRPAGRPLQAHAVQLEEAF